MLPVNFLESQYVSRVVEFDQIYPEQKILARFVFGIDFCSSADVERIEASALVLAFKKVMLDEDAHLVMLATVFPLTESEPAEISLEKLVFHPYSNSYDASKTDDKTIIDKDGYELSEGGQQVLRILHEVGCEAFIETLANTHGAVRADSAWIRTLAGWLKGNVEVSVKYGMVKKVTQPRESHPDGIERVSLTAIPFSDVPSRRSEVSDVVKLYYSWPFQIP